jgi:DNA invertase Pin-like site-specific DNA recombinase
MLYSKKNLIKRLQEAENEYLTERELLLLATPYINNVSQIIAAIQKAIDKGYTGEYSVNFMAKITSITRTTLYRWEKDGIIARKNNKINIQDLLKSISLIESRLKQNVTLL